VLSLPQDIICGYFDGSEFGNLSVSPKRMVSKFEIEFYMEDAKATITDDRVFQIKKHYIQIAKPGQIRYSQLPFRTAFVKFNAEGEIAQRLSQAPDYFRSSHPERIYNKIDEIILLNESGNNLLLQSRMLSLLNLILFDAGIPTHKRGKNYEIIAEAKRYMESNFEKPIKLKNIADSVHLSEIYFHNLFTEAMCITPHQYLLNCRVEHAKKLLWNTKIPICVVAEKTGFGCQQYLNKVFKKETGITPAAYRKSCQNNYIL